MLSPAKEMIISVVFGAGGVVGSGGMLGSIDMVGLVVVGLVVCVGSMVGVVACGTSTSLLLVEHAGIAHIRTISVIIAKNLFIFTSKFSIIVFIIYFIYIVLSMLLLFS
jgi:hypothetical protein